MEYALHQTDTEGYSEQAGGLANETCSLSFHSYS